MRILLALLCGIFQPASVFAAGTASGAGTRGQPAANPYAAAFSGALGEQLGRMAELGDRDYHGRLTVLQEILAAPASPDSPSGQTEPASVGASLAALALSQGVLAPRLPELEEVVRSVMAITQEGNPRESVNLAAQYVVEITRARAALDVPDPGKTSPTRGDLMASAGNVLERARTTVLGGVVPQTANDSAEIMRRMERFFQGGAGSSSAHAAIVSDPRSGPQRGSPAGGPGNLAPPNDP